MLTTRVSELVIFGCKHSTFEISVIVANTHTKCTHWILAGTELIFFIAAPVVLCFGFVTKTVLITQLWFSHC